MAKKKMTLEEKLEEAIVKDVPYEVPQNWVWSKLGVITDIKTGRKDANHGTEDGKYPFYTCASEPIKSPTYSFDGECVILPGNGANVGMALYHKGKFEAYQRTYVLNSVMINTKYVLYNLQFRWKDYNENKQYGSATNYIKLGNITEYEIAIPPLKEQQRIVDKIESLFEKLDKAKELIEEARDDFEKRKSAILEKAFRGELTKEWRKKNQISNNFLESLLNQNKKIKKNFKFSPATEIYVLPKKWKWIKLKDCCEKFKYGTSSKSKEEGRIPVLRMGNLQEGKLDWSNLVYTSDEDEIKKYQLISGDLLFNRTNSPELVGKTSIYEGEREAIYAGYLIRVRTLNDINSKFINYFMNSIFAKHRCMEVKSDGVSQSNINAEKLGDFDIPLPPIEEQKEIVRILDEILEKESKIEELTKIEEQIELIKKSILAKAFRGQLGTNCEDDEMALELLKDILNT